MIKNKITEIRWLIALFFIFVCLGFTNTKDINTVLDDLEKAMAGIKTIQTDFIQEKNLSLFNQKIILKGRVFIKKPDLLSWRVFTPMRYSLVIKGTTISQWDEDTNQVQRITLSKNPSLQAATAQMQSWFYGAYKSMLNDYRITVISQRPLTLEFIPQETSVAQNFIKRVLVTFQGDEYYLKEIRIEERGGDSTWLKFLNPKLNQPINDSAWEAKSDVR